ncbi:methylmalonyl-CoA mutase cobalamin-binding domain/chain [Bradyrhizobium sp. USDA 3256]
MERLTDELAREAWQLMEEVESMGGMARAIASGWPKRLIEESATRKQAAIDRGDQVIVGVNRFRLDHEEPIDILEIDNSSVRASQIKRLAETKKMRATEIVRAMLAAMTQVARTGEGNLLEMAVEAARSRATVGEMSDAMRQAFGDHEATPAVVSDVYGQAYAGDPEFTNLVSRVGEISRAIGMRPKIMIAKLGQDGHDRGAKVIASAFGDVGFDIIAGPLFQTPSEAAVMAVREGVHVLGISSLAAGHKTLIPQVIEQLAAIGGGNVIVVCGGVVPRQDYDALFRNGVAAVFGPGTNVLEAARAVLDLIEGKRSNRL